MTDCDKLVCVCDLQMMPGSAVPFNAVMEEGYKEGGLVFLQVLELQTPSEISQ